MNSELPTLVEVLTQINDPRNSQGRRYSLQSILLLVSVATLCGYRSPKAICEWAHNYDKQYLNSLGFTKTIPCVNTIRRVLLKIDPFEFENRLTTWAQTVLGEVKITDNQLEAIAIDGKTLYGSHHQQANLCHLLSALNHRLGIVLGQIAVPTKTNEITTIKDLIANLNVKNCVITVDAMHTQRETAQLILNQEGHYIQVVKDNQKSLREEIALTFSETSLCAKTEIVEKSEHGGRLEERHLQASSSLVGYCEWPGVQQVLKLVRKVTFKRTGRTRHEIAYAITSLPEELASPNALLKLWREHWHIENRLHYVRDVTFDEDRSQVHVGNLAQVLAAFRNMAISLMRLLGHTNIAAACRRFAARPDLALSSIGLSS